MGIGVLANAAIPWTLLLAHVKIDAFLGIGYAKQVSSFFSRNKSRMLYQMLYQMLSAEAFVGPWAQRTQQVWRPILT